MSRIAIAVGIILAGCTVSQPRVKPKEALAISPTVVAVKPATPASSAAQAAYLYELLTPGETQLLQVFDDSRRTYLTFTDPVPRGLLIFDENGRAVAFSVGERTVIVDGVRTGLLVRTPTKSSYAQAPKQVTLARGEANESLREEASAELPAELAAARAEILRTQERLNGVSAELDKAARGEPSTPLGQLRSEIEEIQTAIDGVTATLVRAHFTTGSSLLALSAEAKAAILAVALHAHEIRILGGTDSSGPKPMNDLLAHARAESMRRLLLNGGVPAEKLRTGVSQEYVATNLTVTGRAQNRRVDVTFANHTAEATP